MRYPIRSQIIWPMTLLMLIVLVANAVIQSIVAQRSTRLRIERRINSVARILRDADFPLTDRVLQQVSGLAAAEFALAGDDGRVAYASNSALKSSLLPAYRSADSMQIQSVSGTPYFHHAVILPPIIDDQHPTLHVLFPTDEYRRVWMRSAIPSFVAAATALLAALAFAYRVGSKVELATRDIVERLHTIANGKFQPQALPRRDDEWRDIAREANTAASLLQSYEADVRDGERMKTMVSVGAGIAHQIRNSVTGSQLALDVHDQENPACKGESIDVAKRQLVRMENYIQRFLLLSRAPLHQGEYQEIDLFEVVQEAITLVAHSAKHLNVSLRQDTKAQSVVIFGDAMLLEQAIVNLLTNAIDAAAAQALNEHDGVVETCLRATPQYVELVVRDNGPGPVAGCDDIFNPFITSKRDGVGLGLAVVREVVQSHHGQVTWRRPDQWTEFVVQLPLEHTK